MKTSHSSPFLRRRAIRGLAALLFAFGLLVPALARADEDDERRVRVLKVEECTDETGAEIPCHGLEHRRRGGYLGVRLTELTPELRAHFGAPEDAGVMVSRVVDGSPAAKAGLRVGDVITAIDGEKVDSSGHVAYQVRAKKEGESAELEVWRDGRLERLTTWPEQREREVFDLSDLVFDLKGLEALPERIDIDHEAIEQALETARSFLESGEMQRQLERIHEIDLEHIEERMEEVRKRLEEVEARLAEELEGLERKRGQL